MADTGGKPGMNGGSPVSGKSIGNSPTSNGHKSKKSHTEREMAEKSVSSPTQTLNEKSVTRRRSMTAANPDGRVLAGYDFRGKDDTKLDLRALSIRSLKSDLVQLSSRLEFVYMPSNRLTSLDGIEVLKRVKVLDLSFNQLKHATLEPLSQCKSLQQFYVAGNQLTTMETLPKLPNLEFLSAGQNALTTLAMQSQPKLQVLVATKNRVGSWKKFPQLPALEHLRIEGNPLDSNPHIVSAALLLVGPTLQKFNDRAISDDERDEAGKYGGHTSMCLRLGWTISSPEEASASMNLFLAHSWGGHHFPPGNTLSCVSIDRPQEEEPCRCTFELCPKGGGSPGNLNYSYQWFTAPRLGSAFEAVPGATKNEYWPHTNDVGCQLKVECRLRIYGKEYGPMSLVTLPVVPGSGIPRMVGVEIVGDLSEGSTLRGVGRVAWCSGTPGKSELQWWRISEGKEPEEIPGAQGPEYKATIEDVGSMLKFVFVPVSGAGVAGESQAATTSKIGPAPPSVANVGITGTPVVNHLLVGRGDYFGGHEGGSIVEWLRKDPSNGSSVRLLRGFFVYRTVDEDIGSEILFKYTPVSVEGVVRAGISASSPRIVFALPPKVEDVVIEGDPVEGSTVRVRGSYTGGTEGASRVQWYRTSRKDFDLYKLELLQPEMASKELCVPREAADHYLVAKYTPVRSDGELGSSVHAVTTSKCRVLPPAISDVSLSGGCVEGAILTASYTYTGGFEGESRISWHRELDGQRESLQGIAGGFKYQLTKRDIGHYIYFECTPVRRDLEEGEAKSARSTIRILPGNPRINTLRVLGDPREDSELNVEVEYFGGDEGKSSLQWCLTRPDGTREEIEGATGLSYTVTARDLDCLISVSYLPERADGLKGGAAFSSFVGPVAPAAPRCVSLQLQGQWMEGGRLTYQAAYKGGRPGDCQQQWFRRDSQGGEALIGNSESLMLSGAEIGCSLRLEYTPVREDGEAGSPCSGQTGIIEAGLPEARELQLLGEVEEDVEIVPLSRYFGGQEGGSRWTWYRSREQPAAESSISDLITVADTRTYTPRVADIGCYMIVEWTPVRLDGKVGKPKRTASATPVSPGPPRVRNVVVKYLGNLRFAGEGEYRGGRERHSNTQWFRIPNRPPGHTDRVLLFPSPPQNGVDETRGGSMFYDAKEEDFGCRLIFEYTPRRMDGISGPTVASEPSQPVYPDLPAQHNVTIMGKPVEGEELTAAEIVGDESFDKFKKGVTFQWSRASRGEGPFAPLFGQSSCSYQIRLEDIGCHLKCTCVISDVFGRSAPPVEKTIGPVLPAKPKVTDVKVEGTGLHSSTFTVKALYSGGFEGPSKIQWFRVLPNDVGRVAVQGETGKVHEGSVDDVGCKMMVRYTPARSDGEVGDPVTATSEVVTVDAPVAKEVKAIVDSGASCFETQTFEHGIGQKRVVDVNRKRLKVVRPGSRTSFSSTEAKILYAPPFQIEVNKTDHKKLKFHGKDSEVELTVSSRHLRDVIVLAVRELARQSQLSAGRK